MRDRNPFILADLVQMRAEEKPDHDVLTFEHESLDGGATPDEVRTYADLQTRANRIAAGLIARGMEVGDRFAIMIRNHPEFAAQLGLPWRRVRGLQRIGAAGRARKDARPHVAARG